MRYLLFLLTLSQATELAEPGAPDAGSVARPAARPINRRGDVMLTGQDYIVVRWEGEPRIVLVDGRRTRQTGKRIQVETGTHLISLEGAADFQPAVQKVIVEDTSLARPHEVIFDAKTP